LAAPTAQGQDGKSVLDGVYTVEQAKRGAALNEEACATCHMDDDFTGTLLESWAGASVGALFDLIRTTMPQDRPSGLSRRQYADIMAYILELNGLPAGDEELPTGRAALENILIERNP
jgi:mono/diheme cytochrome c family protein